MRRDNTNRYQMMNRMAMSSMNKNDPNSPILLVTVVDNKGMSNMNKHSENMSHKVPTLVPN